MRSHFLLPRGVATACAVAGASTLLNSNCSAQQLVAADYATNSAYAGGWTNGQNAGHGFGAWSFNLTDPDPLTNSAGVLYQYEGIGTASTLGTAWTLLTHSTNSGLANAGRAIPGGLQPGQTFETVLQNPSVFSYYRGFDILLTSGPDNNGAGTNDSVLRAQVFSFHNPSEYWAITDAAGTTHLNGAAAPAFTATLSAAAGMKLDFAMVSTNTYSLTMTPLSDPSMAYTQVGPVTTNVSWFNFRLYDVESGGLNDAASNFSISSMTISPLTLNIQKDGTNVLLSWPGAFTNFNLIYSTNLSVPGWNPVSATPAIVNGQNVVTNPITDGRQFYRLQLQQ